MKLSLLHEMSTGAIACPAGGGYKILGKSKLPKKVKTNTKDQAYDVAKTIGEESAAAFATKKVKANKYDPPDAKGSGGKALIRGPQGEVQKKNY